MAELQGDNATNSAGTGPINFPFGSKASGIVANNYFFTQGTNAHYPNGGATIDFSGGSSAHTADPQNYFGWNGTNTFTLAPGLYAIQFGCETTGDNGVTSYSFLDVHVNLVGALSTGFFGQTTFNVGGTAVLVTTGFGLILGDGTSTIQVSVNASPNGSPSPNTNFITVPNIAICKLG